jgi:hypothetical protein
MVVTLDPALRYREFLSRAKNGPEQQNGRHLLRWQTNYSATTSARARRDGGAAKPRALAVLKLIANIARSA